MFRLALSRVERPLRSGRFWVAIAFACLLYSALTARVALIDDALPYCRHVDERTWTKRATVILQTSDLNPHRFNKPSMMVYLNTFGLALGLVRAGSHGDPAHAPAALSSKQDFPYYSSPTAIATLRYLYALLSVATMALAAACVRRMTANDLAALVSLPLMMSSAFYLNYSWHYLNVDLLGCFFAFSAIYYAISRGSTSDPRLEACICGLLGGLTLGTKYNLFWIAVPLLLRIVSSSPRRWPGLTMLFFVCMGATFVLTTPYAVLDVEAFTQAAAGEAFHYATGHKQQVWESGVPMLLKYLSGVPGNFGWPLSLCALVGLIHALWKTGIRGWILVSYPLLLLLYMSKQHVFFERNLLILQLMTPLLAAIGMHALWPGLRSRISARFPQLSLAQARSCAFGVFALGCALGAPWSKTADAYALGQESRNVASQWILENVPAETRLVIPEELQFSPHLLGDRYELIFFEGKSTSWQALPDEYPGGLLFLPEFEEERPVRWTRELNSVRGLRVRKSFGQKPLTFKVKREKRIVAPVFGDPRFSLVEL